MTTRRFTASIVLPAALTREQVEAMLKQILPGGAIVRVTEQ